MSESCVGVIERKVYGCCRGGKKSCKKEESLRIAKMLKLL